MNENHVYDMIIVGGGPGGYTSALYAARAGFDTIVLEKLSAGGQMSLTWQIDNYPGFENGIDGFSLAEKMQKQAEKFGAKSEYAEVFNMDLTGKLKRVETSSGIYIGKTVVIATGANPRELGLDKEKELIQQIIAVCKDEGKEEYIPEYESRLKSVEYYINKQNEKGELDKAYSLQKEGKYKEALDLYLFYFNKDKFVLNLIDRIIQCYRKLNDKSNETRMLEYALKNKLSESNKLKYEKRLEKLKQEQ